LTVCTVICVNNVTLSQSNTTFYNAKVTTFQTENEENNKEQEQKLL